MTQTDASLTEGALFTDQYQLSMAQLYFREGVHERPARFDFTFRSYPDYGRHQAGYCIFAGLADLLDWMTSTRFTAADLDQLRTQRNAVGEPVFGDDFLGWLETHGRFDAVDLVAAPEGSVVHPHAPILTAQGPLAIAQILETSLLNHLNYPTLVATKASRVAEAARGGPVLEFGMRRGPGTGANAGARAALVGGARLHVERWGLAPCGRAAQGHPCPLDGAVLHGRRGWRARGLSSLRPQLSGRLHTARRHHRHPGERCPQRHHRVS